jgi:dUTP pyrophosphatase
MLVEIKRFDKELPLPQYKTKGSACFDLSARVDVVVAAKQVAYIPLNIAIKVPEGYWSLLTARSSLHKKGLMMAYGVGIIDADYCGDNDELIISVYNFFDSEVTIEKGTRVAQLMINKLEAVEIKEVDSLDSLDRGGFGSTGDR